MLITVLLCLIALESLVVCRALQLYEHMERLRMQVRRPPSLAPPSPPPGLTTEPYPSPTTSSPPSPTT